MKPLHKQLALFATTGVIATLTHIGVGAALHRLAGVEPFSANFLAFAAATCVTLYGNSEFAFRHRQRRTGDLPRAIVTVIFGLILNQAIVLVVTGWLGAPYEAALAVIVVTVPAATFLLLKFWAFRG